MVSPEATTDADGGWLSGPLRRTRNIYRWTILWRTARALFAAGAIMAPGDLRRLIGAVYDQPEEDVPAGLARALAEETGAESAAIQMARLNVLKWRDGYAQDQGWDSDVRTPTRLAEESVTFRLGRWRDGVLAPWYAAESAELSWALSEVSLAAWRASSVPSAGGAPAQAVTATKQRWGRWDRDIPLLVLQLEADTWEGRVATERVERRVRYDARIGLVLQDP